MKKEDLRLVEYDIKTIPKKGWFHQFITKKEEENNSEYVVALIETEEGNLKEHFTWNIKFLD